MVISISNLSMVRKYKLYDAVHIISFTKTKQRKTFSGQYALVRKDDNLV